MSTLRCSHCGHDRFHIQSLYTMQDINRKSYICFKCNGLTSVQRAPENEPEITGVEIHLEEDDQILKEINGL